MLSKPEYFHLYVKNIRIKINEMPSGLYEQNNKGYYIGMSKSNVKFNHKNIQKKIFNYIDEPLSTIHNFNAFAQESLGRPMYF